MTADERPECVRGCGALEWDKRVGVWRVNGQGSGNCSDDHGKPWAFRHHPRTECSPRKRGCKDHL